MGLLHLCRFTNESTVPKYFVSCDPVVLGAATRRDPTNQIKSLRYSTASETFISFTLTNVEFRKSRDFFAWILRGSSVGFAWN